MFRRGGSTGGGITSGLSRQGYKRGRVVEPGGYQGDTDWSDLMKGYGGFREEYQKHVGDRPRSTNLNDFLISFGLNMVGNEPSGNIFQTAAKQAQEPFGKFQERKAYEDVSKRDEERDLIKSYITSRAEMLSGESAASIFKDEKIAGLGKETLKSMWEHNDKFDPSWTEDSPEYQQWLKDKALIDSDFDNFEKESGIDMETIMGGQQGILNLQEGWAKNLKQSEEMMKHPVTGEEIEVGEFYSDPNNRGHLQEKIIEMTFDYMGVQQDKQRGWKSLKAKGGRAGYQQGELVEQADVNVMTPQGDVNMQETVEEGAEPDQLSYEELRSRLPVEITDDIIRLMVNSTEALTDFSQIQTQQDIDNFNAKYGVNLVLPSEA